ncbi:MAG: F0F1 ATP synthase subunit I [Alphaproteobacteria bacterium RIFOXYD12_FULL_60_8]|nr:MAG: F0F1 ATP synthase subunit I [Alphaproteobacteria bacterium RIFOXYD12_FULL_60_8]
MDETKKSPTLDDIETRLNAARSHKDARPGGSPREGRANAKGMGVAVRIGVELVCAVGVGVGIGYVLDRWLGTTPWLMALFLLLGGAAGVMNVYRVVKGLDDTIGLGQAIRRKEELENSSRQSEK